MVRHQAVVVECVAERAGVAVQQHDCACGSSLREALADLAIALDGLQVAAGAVAARLLLEHEHRHLAFERRRHFVRPTFAAERDLALRRELAVAGGQDREVLALVAGDLDRRARVQRGRFERIGLQIRLLVAERLEAERLPLLHDVVRGLALRGAAGEAALARVVGEPIRVLAEALARDEFELLRRSFGKGRRRAEVGQLRLRGSRLCVRGILGRGCRGRLAARIDGAEQGREQRRVEAGVRSEEGAHRRMLPHRPHARCRTAVAWRDQVSSSEPDSNRFSRASSSRTVIVFVCDGTTAPAGNPFGFRTFFANV